MNFRKLVWRSMRLHWLSTFAATVSMMLGIALTFGVIILRDATHRQFTRVGLGIDAVLGPKGSPLQIVLNSIYHLEEMPGTIPWTFAREIASHPVVDAVIPFCTGHSYAGIRVNSVDPRFVDGFDIGFGKKLTCDPAAGGQGRGFSSANAAEAIIGWDAARRLGLRLGDQFNPVCGVDPGNPVHEEDRLRFVGILAPTGTPHDRAIYIPLERFYSLSGHSHETSAMAIDLEHREISGAFVRVKRIRGNLMHPGIQDLRFRINQSPVGQLVIPNETLPQLFRIIGWVDRVLGGIAILVVAMASLFLLVSLLNTLRERRRDYALLRALGTTRAWVFGLVLAEAAAITCMGAIGGLFLGYGIAWQGSKLIAEESGVQLEMVGFEGLAAAILCITVVFGLLVGLLPAMGAYRLQVLDSLRAGHSP